MSSENADILPLKTGQPGHPNSKGFLGTRHDQPASQGRLEAQMFGSRLKAGPGSEMQGYYEENSFPDFGHEEYGAGLEEMGFAGGPGDFSFGKMGQYHPGRMLMDMQKDGMRDHQKDMDVNNPLLFKPASKPPVIREGDWLCPELNVPYVNAVLQRELGQTSVL